MTEEKTLKTISDDALKRANAIKDDYFRFFNAHNVKYASGNFSKPYIGDLSPGCLTCINGTWSCIYINGLCTKNCFYCPQDRKIKKERPPHTDEHIKFNSVDDYINYLRRYPFEGIGFSGGEPLMVFDKLLDYIKEIRKVFGSTHYVWIYTNGDLVTEESLNLLNKAGLDEIRFDASANGYDLKSIKKAAKYIKTVSIEIPAIPEDLEFVKSHLKEFEEIGVKHLNLHQLMMTKHNKDAFEKRNYSVLHANLYEDDYPVLESELAGFEIIQHAIKVKSKIGINYCSRCYKARFQGKAFRKIYLSLNGDDPNMITSTGFVRVFSTDSPPDEISALKNISNQSELKPINGGNGSAFVLPPKYFFRFLEANEYRKVNATYYYPKTKPFKNEDPENSKLLKFGKIKISFFKDKVCNIELKNKSSAIFFQKLFIENKSFERTADEALNLYGMGPDEKQGMLEDIKSFYTQFEDIEYTPKNMPDYER